MLTRRGFLRAVGATALSGGVYACGIEPTWLETVRMEIALESLDPAFQGYVVAQISDLHVGSGVPLPYLRRAVDAVNAARPDLVVVTGDIVDGCAAPGAVEDAAGVLAGLRPGDAALAVLGNHDTGAFHPGVGVDERAVGRLAGALAAAGIDLLRNEERTLERGRGRLRVAGFGDLWSDGFDARRFRAAPGEATLALSHNPDTAPELAGRGAGLVLSGHTHGGQVRIPLFGPPYYPVRHRELMYGHHRIGATQVYVNPGLGYSHRIRFLARPELTLFRLTVDLSGACKSL
ncbi:MAG TPA: metallophosphoesterase [Candidatus Eisenbacteria bacterium]|nr:metallophosphoesterase [Candidatus Eisenbacteria bacterium]